MAFIHTVLGCLPEQTSDSDSDITKVYKSKSSGFGSVNDDFIAEIEGETNLMIFEEALSRAKKQLGEVNVLEPEFDLEVHYHDGSTESFHLWIGPQTATLMKVNDPGTIYTIPAYSSKKLANLFSEI